MPSNATPAVDTVAMADDASALTSRERRREMKHRITELSRRFDSWAASGEAEGWPADEWSCLVSPVVRLLSAGASADEIASRISAELQDHYGLADKPDLAFAAELRRWWDDQEARAV